MGIRADIYWNLHKKVFSVRAIEGRHKGRVIAHCHDVMLEDVSFVVDEAGRQRVIAMKRKNVHAFVRGTVVRAAGTAILPCVGIRGLKKAAAGCRTRMPSGARPLSYNPYRGPGFYLKDSGDDVRTAATVRAVARRGRAIMGVIGAAA